MKFKFKHIIATFALAGVMALGVGAALNIHSEAESVNADSVSGSLIVKFEADHNWFQGGAKICAYITNDSQNVWTSLQTTSSSQLIYKFDYSVSFTPTKLIWVRMNPSETSGSWDSKKKWNQTGDLGWKEATYIPNGWDYQTCSQWNVSADIRSSLVPSFGTKQVLSTIGINDSGNPEVSGKVSLAENEEFKMLAGDGTWSGYYGVADGLGDYFTGGSKTERSDDNPNIVCHQTGDYDFYFDTESKRLWITNDALVAADGWAREFLQDVKCDSTGSSVPTGWSTSASYYAGISDDAKDLVYGSASNESGSLIEQALARYDYAVAHHSGLSRFVVNHSGAQRPVARIVSTPQTISEVTGTTATVVVIAVTLVSVTAIATYVFMRKRKENQ